MQGRQSRLLRICSRILLLLSVLPFLSSAYHPGSLGPYLLAGALQSALIAAAAWALGRGSGDEASASPGGLDGGARLFIAAWALVSLALSMQAPPQGRAWLATVPDQQVRYGALTLGGVTALLGTAALAQALRATGQGRWALLALAAAGTSLLLYAALFGTYPATVTARFQEAEALGADPGWWYRYRYWHALLGIVHRVLLTAGTLLFLVPLRRLQVLSRLAALAVSAAALLVGIIGLLIHLPPAVSFVPLHCLGIAVLGRDRVGAASSDPRSPASSSS